MGMMIDIDDFYERYMFHATNKAEAEFNQIIKEIKKTEAIPKANNEIYSNLKTESFKIANDADKNEFF